MDLTTRTRQGENVRRPTTPPLSPLRYSPPLRAAATTTNDDDDDWRFPPSFIYPPINCRPMIWFAASPLASRIAADGMRARIVDNYYRIYVRTSCRIYLKAVVRPSVGPSVGHFLGAGDGAAQKNSLALFCT